MAAAKTTAKKGTVRRKERKNISKTELYAVNRSKRRYCTLNHKRNQCKGGENCS